MLILETLLILFPICIHFSNGSSNYTKSISEEEKEYCEIVRSELKSELYSDFMKEDSYLIRWIRDQDYNLNSTVAKLRKSLKWRKDNEIDLLMTKDFSDISGHCKYKFEGEDKDGRPIVSLMLGKCDIRRLVLSGNLERIESLFYQMFEFIAESIIQKVSAHQDIYQGIIILDASGFNLIQHACLRCIPLYVNVLQTYEQNYPEYCESIYFINVPRIFYQMMDLIYPFISKKLKNTIKFYGYNKNEWSTVLLDSISSNQLPVYLGGTKKLEVLEKQNSTRKMVEKS